MHYPTKHDTGQLNKHVVVFSVSIGMCVSSGVATRRAGAQGIASMPAAQYGRVAIKHNGSRLGEVAEHKTSLELQILKIR